MVSGNEGIVTLEDVFEELIGQNIIDDEEVYKKLKGYSVTNATPSKKSDKRDTLVEIPLELDKN